MGGVCISGRCSASRRAALVIGHPGHELRVYGWLEALRPIVFVLTDGSGQKGQSRLLSTGKLLMEAGARVGSVYGRFTDAEVYRAILAGKAEPFTQVVRELAECFTREKIEYVVGDALEGFNPTHDLCRHLINASIALYERTVGSSLPNLEFSLVAAPFARPPFSREGALCVELAPDALSRKLNAAAGYAELKTEINAALAEFGLEAFRHERLWPVDPLQGTSEGVQTPFYEDYGQRQVESGLYQAVIREREHILPLLTRLWSDLAITAPSTAI